MRLSCCSIASVAIAILTLTGCSATTTNPNGKNSSYNLSPSSRTLKPVAVVKTKGQVTSPNAVLSGGKTVLQAQGSYLVFDFGKEVGGIVSLQFGDASDTKQSLAMSFSESSLYTGMTSDQSNGGNGEDGFLSLNVVPHGMYVMPTAKLRGGFRYLTIGLTSSGRIELTGVTLQFTPAPALADLRAYRGSFVSSNDMLNRIWYAGAYTVQLDTIDPTQGRVWPPPASGWLNNGMSGLGSTILADGAKRDRVVWPGDLDISSVTAYVSTGDTLSVKNDLETLFSMQNADGGLPDVGPEVNFGTTSDTYHLWTLDAVVNYYLYSGDQAWLLAHWPQIQNAIQFSSAKIDSNGLMSVNLTADWGRQSSGGEEISANALFYHVLRGASFLATTVGDPVMAAEYDAQASDLRAAIQSRLWDSAAGMYSDVPGSTLFPQDGNALALWFGIPESLLQCAQISSNLKHRWNGFGAVTPERPGAIATFPGSMEVMAHFAAGEDANALDLIQLEWGYMLASPVGTGSTFWEGYLQDGSFDYGGSYMSLAHGWATAPTAALTEYVGGIGPELSSSVQFHFIPHVGDLSFASVTVPLPRGTVTASWSRSSGRFVANVEAPASMTGRYGVPADSAATSVFVDGTLVWSTCASVSAVGFGEISKDGGYVYLSHVQGSHTIVVNDVCAP